MDDGLGFALRWWHGLGYDVHYLVWLVSGVLLLTLVLVFCYHLMRRLAGQRKFRGVWYSDSQYQALLGMLMDDHKAGSRVMRYDELQLLRREMLGTDFKPVFRGKHGGYL